MPELSIHLRETFKNDALVIHINGVSRRRLEGLTTKLLLGYAAVFGEQVEEGLNRIDVELVSKGQSASIVVDCISDAFLEVWFKDGQLTLHTPPEPPAYL